MIQITSAYTISMEGGGAVIRLRTQIYNMDEADGVVPHVFMDCDDIDRILGQDYLTIYGFDGSSTHMKVYNIPICQCPCGYSIDDGLAILLSGIIPYDEAISNETWDALCRWDMGVRKLPPASGQLGSDIGLRNYLDTYVVRT